MTEQEWIDCRTLCRHFNYDSYGDDDYEICDKGHELYPNTCPDFKIKRNKQHFKMDSFGIYDGEYINRMDRIEIYRKLNEQHQTIMELSIENNALRKDKQKATERIQFLQEINQKQSESHKRINDVLENGGVLLTKKQLDEIIRELPYRKKVTETLQEAYNLTNKSHVFEADKRSGKYLGQLLQQSNLRLLLKLAEKLEVDLK